METSDAGGPQIEELCHGGLDSKWFHPDDMTKDIALHSYFMVVSSI